MIYAYKNTSESAKTLRDSLSTKLISHNNSNYKGNEDKIVINWGASQMPEEVTKSKIINHPSAVAICSDKTKFFEHVKGTVNTPPYSKDPEEIFSWFQQGHTVVLRSLVSGHSGAGISIAEPGVFEDFQVFKGFWKQGYKFATIYVPKKEEYRVHVVDGKVIGVRRKVAKKDTHIRNWKVRSHKNGFVFQKNDIDPDPKVLEQAVISVKAVGLDFGAVDVVWNAFREQAYVLEINTAPGLEGSTVEDYSKALIELTEKVVGKKSNFLFSKQAEITQDHSYISDYINTVLEEVTPVQYTEYN